MIRLLLPSSPPGESIVQTLFISRNENHPCVCTCAIGELFINSLTSVFVVPLMHSWAGRGPSQVITAPAGHPLQSPATLQMCVFSSAEGNMAGKSGAGRQGRVCMCVCARACVCVCVWGCTIPKRVCGCEDLPKMSSLW